MMPHGNEAHEGASSPWQHAPVVGTPAPAGNNPESSYPDVRPSGNIFTRWKLIHSSHGTLCRARQALLICRIIFAFFTFIAITASTKTITSHATSPQTDTVFSWATSVPAFAALAAVTFLDVLWVLYMLTGTQFQDSASIRTTAPDAMGNSKPVGCPGCRVVVPSWRVSWLLQVVELAFGVFLFAAAVASAQGDTSPSICRTVWSTDVGNNATAYAGGNGANFYCRAQCIQSGTVTQSFTVDATASYDASCYRLSSPPASGQNYDAPNCPGGCLNSAKAWCSAGGGSAALGFFTWFALLGAVATSFRVLLMLNPEVPFDRAAWRAQRYGNGPTVVQVQYVGGPQGPFVVGPPPGPGVQMGMQGYGGQPQMGIPVRTGGLRAAYSTSAGEQA